MTSWQRTNISSNEYITKEGRRTLSERAILQEPTRVSDGAPKKASSLKFSTRQQRRVGKKSLVKFVEEEDVMLSEGGTAGGGRGKGGMKIRQWR